MAKDEAPVVDPNDTLRLELADYFAALAVDNPTEYAAIVPDDAFLEAFGVIAP